MEILIVGDGGLGRAIAAACREQGEPEPRVVGRPADGRHDPATLGRPDVAFEATTGDAVRDNVDAILGTGCRSLVIATTGWDGDREPVDATLRSAGAAAVVAANFSPVNAVFLRVVEDAARRLGALGRLDPYIVECHRRTKRDRPSGTALELARRMSAAAMAPAEISSVRAGTGAATHLVGFEGAGEAIELRFVARDRAGYAEGALLAARWLHSAPRSAGIHPFEKVLGDLPAAGGDPGSTRVVHGGRRSEVAMAR